jgi:Mg2+-importing ATPase
LRDGQAVELLSEQIVAGDVLLLSAGSIVPGDCRLLESADLFVNEAALTGEVRDDMPLAKRHNVLFQGSHVVSGAARAVVVATGAAHLALQLPALDALLFSLALAVSGTIVPPAKV